MSVDQKLFGQTFLNSCDDFGLVGYWKWNFVTSEHSWSEGLYKLLGFVPGEVSPSYSKLLEFVLPEDRERLGTAAQIINGTAITDCTVRMICRDGSFRALQCRGKSYCDPNGRPRAATGIVLDVSNHDRLVRVQAAERRRRRALFAQYNIFSYALPASPPAVVPPELIALTGLPEEVIRNDVHAIEIPEERSYWRDYFQSHDRLRDPFMGTPTLVLADKRRVPFEVISVPIWSLRETFEEWSILLRPLNSPKNVLSGEVRYGLEQYLEGAHIRAARALLDWSMNDLARASGLSLSTIRRLEEGGADQAGRSRHTIAEALRRAGIRFTLVGREIAVSRTQPPID